LKIGGTFGGTGRLSRARRGPICIQNLEPTAGLEPATRYLQIRQQLNSARYFGFPYIRNASIECGL